MNSTVYLHTGQIYAWANALRDVARALPSDAPVPVAPQLNAIIEQMSQCASSPAAATAPDALESVPALRILPRMEVDTDTLIRALRLISDASPKSDEAARLLMQALHLPDSPLDGEGWGSAVAGGVVSAAAFVRKHLSAIVAAERVRAQVFLRENMT